MQAADIEDRSPLNTHQRDSKVQRVLIIELLLNLLVASAKGVYGFYSGSLAIAADAVHSFVDASANILGILILKKSAQPPDHSHPYGHRKFEVLGATALGVAIGAVGINLGLGAIGSLWTESEPPITDRLGLVVIVGTLLVNIFVARYEAAKARELKSGYLEADAAHTASDVLVTLVILLGFAGSHYGIFWADGIAAVVVVIVILRVSWAVLSTNIGVLVNRAQANVAEVEAVVLSVEGIEGCHRIRSHGTPDAIIVDLHAQADGQLSLEEGHILAHEVEEALCASDDRIVDVTVHMEPTGDPEEHL